VQEHCHRLTEKYPGSVLVAGAAQVFCCVWSLFNYLYCNYDGLLCWLVISKQFTNIIFNDLYESYCGTF